MLQSNLNVPPQKFSNTPTTPYTPAKTVGAPMEPDIGVVSEGLNLFLVVSTFMLWRATSKSAQIAERTLVDLERPWLFLAGATIRRRDLPGQPLTPNFWFIKLHWKNVGRSPALTQECIFECKPKVGLPAEPVYSNDHPGLNLPYTVAAGDTVETSEVGPAPGQNEILVFYG